MTARELAQRLEVSQRTIYRDMEALSAAGVPVYAERGVDGGWSLLDTYQTNLTGLDKAAEAALIKLLAALPTIRRRDAEYVRRRIHVDGDGWFQSKEGVQFLPTLQEAIWQERKLALFYQCSGGPIVECLVDPLGLVVKGRVWYLVAAVEGEKRTYRVSRVREARVTDEPCARPKGFDLAAHWEASVARFKADLPHYLATVRVAPDIVRRVHALA